MKKLLFALTAPALFAAVSCTSVALEKNADKTAQSTKVTESIIAIPNARTTTAHQAGVLYGKLYEPCDGARHPAIIASHGYNGSFADFAEDGAYFAKNGFVAFSYDFAGGSTRSKSTGASTDMTLLTEKQDLHTVIDYIRGLESVDGNRLYLLGASQGGLVSALTAEEVPDIRAIALYYPAFCIPDDWRRQYPAGAQLPETVDFWGLRLGKRFIETATALTVTTATGSYAKPVLIIHGTEDKIVSLSYAEEAQKRYPSARLVVLNGEGHGFSPAAAAKARELVLEHFKQAE